MTQLYEGLRERLLEDARAVEGAYYSSVRTAVNLREAAEAISTLLDRCIALEGALEAIASAEEKTRPLRELVASRSKATEGSGDDRCPTCGETNAALVCSDSFHAPLSQPSTPAGEDMLTDLRMSLEALVAGEASVDETECDILNLPEFRQSDAAEIARLREVGRNILPYLRWTIGPESPGHHPTMPSAVASFEAALGDAR